MFRLMRPKPPHGWNAVVWELGIVTAGVLIALGAQQVAQGFNDRADAARARAAIRTELQTNMSRLDSRSAIRSCVERRIEEVQVLLEGAAKSGVIDTPRWIGRPQYWTMQIARWEALAQAGRAALLSDDELGHYSQLHHWMRNITSEMVVEQADWAKLRTLEHLSDASPDVLIEFNLALQDARYRHWRITQHTALLAGLAREARLKVVPNSIPAPRSACVAMDTPRPQAIRESGSPYGEP